MTDHGYTAIQDPYCYPQSTVLRNRIGFLTQAELDNHEALATASRFADPLPAGNFDVTHYRSIHKHLFQDVFDWAGEYRTVRIAKAGSMFCYPEFIESEMGSLFEMQSYLLLRSEQSRATFAKHASSFLADLKAIHLFREGNGRAQLAFFAMLSAHVGHPLRPDTFEPEKFLQAMINSFNGDYSLLELCILDEVTEGKLNALSP